jgi:hypothetical protein
LVQTSSALAWTLELEEPDYFDAKHIMLIFSGGVASADYLQVTLKSSLGASHDVVLKRLQITGTATVTISDINNLLKGDSLLIEFGNTGALTIDGWAILERAKPHEAGVISTGTVIADGIILSEPLELRGYDPANDVVKVMEDNALSLHFTDPAVIRIGPITAGVPDVSVRIDMEGYRGCVAALYYVSGGDTTEWTMDAAPDGALSGSRWLPATLNGWKSASIASAALYTADGILYSVKDFRPPGHRFNVDVVGANANNLYDCVYVKWW